jgi:WD40 repeat protein
MAWFNFRRFPDPDTCLTPSSIQRGRSVWQKFLSPLLPAGVVASIALLAGCSGTQPTLPPQAEQLTISPTAPHPWHNTRLDRAFLAFKAPVKSLAISADGNTLISGSLNGDTKLWNLSTDAAIHSLTDRPAIQSIAVSPAAASPDQPQLFASSDYQGGIELHDLPNSTLRRTLVGHSTVVQSVAFSSDGKILASGCWDKTVNLWDVTTGNLLHTLTGHSFGVTAVAFVPQSNSDGSEGTSQDIADPLLVSADYDGGIKLWRSISGQLVRTFAADRYPIFALAISPDGKTLVAGSGNGSIKSWKLPSGRYLTNFSGHTDVVTTVAISPDGQTLASGSRDRTIQLWDLSTGDLVQTLSGDTVDSILALTFSPDGQLLISGDQEGMIQVWRREEG